MCKKMEQRQMDSRSIERLQDRNAKGISADPVPTFFEKTEQKPNVTDCNIIRGTRMERDSDAKGRKSGEGGEGGREEKERLSERMQSNLHATS